VSSGAFVFFQEFYEGYDEETVLKTDESALACLSRSGFDPKTLSTLMERLASVEKVYREKGYVTSLFLSKPGLEGRAGHVRRILEEK
jgi:predicted Zn-dependent protease